MDTKNTIFKNRKEAGEKLAEELKKYSKEKPLILALPRGGVPIGFEVAKKLHSPLDTLVVRKLGAPWNKEFGFGAIAPGDVLMLDRSTIDSLDLTEETINEVIEAELHEMERRIILYRSGKETINSQSSTIIIIDDGLATGVTARTAVESARLSYKPEKIIFASPVCASDSVKRLEPYVDKIICLSQPKDLIAIGEYYDSFNQVSDEEVLEALKKANEMSIRNNRTV